MANLPINFRNSGEGAVASYSFTDIASGTGIELFYGAVAPSGTYFLTSKQIYSDVVISGDQTSDAATSEGAATAVLDKDFDVQFNLPRTIRGRCVVEIPHGWRDSATQTNDTYQKIVAYIRKWDGATETNLVSMTGSTWLATGQTNSNTDTKVNLSVLSGEIPVTNFKKGEYLRLTVQDRTWNAGGGIINRFIGHDPQGRTTNNQSLISGGVQLSFGTLDPTALRVHVPFRIDL